MYQKTWLQFAFPLYIWLLVGLIIILTHYSTQVMRLLGRKVIPVLATLPYTLLLTFGQCLRSLPRRKGLRWLRSTAFISIMDAYHAPFNRRHRYWIGLLLLIRCVLVNITVYVTIYHSDTAAITNTFILLMVTTGLLMIKIFVKDGIHKSAINKVIESSFC